MFLQNIFEHPKRSIPKENGYTTYRIRKEKLLGQRTLTALKRGEGNIDNKTLEKFCELFDCQPGDLMEYKKKISAK